MKIFWRIFMRQISLTDYFCKGLSLFGLLKEDSHKKSPKCLGRNLEDFANTSNLTHYTVS